jgi:hypothetical protein
VTAPPGLTPTGERSDLEGRRGGTGELSEKVRKVAFEDEDVARHSDAGCLEAGGARSEAKDRAGACARKRVVGLEALGSDERERVRGQAAADPVPQTGVGEVARGEGTHRDGSRRERDDPLEVRYLDEGALPTALVDPTAGRPSSARTCREEAMLELEGNGGPFCEVRQSESAGRPDDVDPLDPFPKVVPQAAERLVEPGDPFDRRSVPALSDRHQPAATQLAIGVRHGLDREPEALRDRPQLGRLEGGAFVQEEELGDRSAAPEPGEPRRPGRTDIDHGWRRLRADKTVFTVRETGLA